MKYLSFILLSLMMSTTLMAKKKSKEKMVEIITDKGTIVVKLYDDVPKHAENFYKLASEGFYDSTLFHRVIDGFMIQGGDPNSKNAASGTMLGNGDVGYKIPAEFNTKYIHKRGALAMARDNNPQKASSGCQFYIVEGKKMKPEELKRQNNMSYTPEQIKIYEEQGGTPFLDQNYTVFGEVVSGMDVVEAIAKAPKNSMDRPNEDIRMKMKVKKSKNHFLFF